MNPNTKHNYFPIHHFVHIGLLNFYTKFLPNPATTLTFLYSLLQKGQPLVRSSLQHCAFMAVKSLLTLSALLAHHCDQKELTLVCDVSSYSLATVLLDWTTCHVVIHVYHVFVLCWLLQICCRYVDCVDMQLDTFRIFFPCEACSRTFQVQNFLSLLLFKWTCTMLC